MFIQMKVIKRKKIIFGEEFPLEIEFNVYIYLSILRNSFYSWKH